MLKAILLMALGLAGLLGVAHQAGEWAAQAVSWLGLFPGHTQVHRALMKVARVDDATAAKFGVAALAYAAVFSVEGVGLLMGKRWAEWLTVVVTSSFIPVEVYEMVERFSAGKVVALAVNIAIVIYLVARRIEERGHRHPRPRNRRASSAGRHRATA